jgi:hypothetical protein
MLQASRADQVANATSRARVYLTREELWEVYEAYCRAHGRVQFKKDRFNNCCKLYDLWRRWHAQGGDGTVTARQMAQALGCELHNITSVRRWMAVWVEQGVISKEEVLSMTGKKLGLRVDLRPVDEIQALMRGCSSAG